MDTLTIEDDAKARVAAGVAFLDQARPGWRESIEVPVDIRSSYECVLAQVVGCRYPSALDVLDMTSEQGWDLGFHCWTQYTQDNQDRWNDITRIREVEWDALQAAWLTALAPATE